MNSRSNAELASYQIAKHGKDRYPTPKAQFIKLVEEVGEIGKELNREKTINVVKMAGELADTALALYNLADKFSIDLDRAIAAKVEHDERRFD